MSTRNRTGILALRLILPTFSPAASEYSVVVSKTILNSKKLNKINFSKELDFGRFYFL